MAIGDEDAAVVRHDDVGWRVEMVAPTACLAVCAKRHQHLAGGAELHHDVAARSGGCPLFTHRVGHPDVAVRIDINPVRPDEHPAPEALCHRAVRPELDDRIEIGVEAFAPEVFRAGIAAENRPDVLAVRIDGGIADGADHAAAWQLHPVVHHPVRVRIDLAAQVRRGAQRDDCRNGRDKCRAVCCKHGCHSFVSAWTYWRSCARWPLSEFGTA